MKNIIIINGINISEFAFQSVFDKKNSIEKVLEFAQSLPDTEKSVMFLSKNYSDITGIDTIVKNNWNTEEFLKNLSEISKGYDNIFYFYADTPFLDKKIARRMYNNHLKYFAEYTFADGYPYGLSLEIIKPHILSALQALLKENDSITRDFIFSIIKRDINSFDLETELSSSDVRLLRVSLTADTKRNFNQMQRICEAGGKDEISILACIQEKPELLRTFPSYIQVQIVEGCPQKCSYCAYPVILTDTIGKKNEMPAEQCLEIANKAVDYAGDITMSISLWGEPSLHSGIYSLIRDLTLIKNLKLVIETSGIGWDPAQLKTLKDQCVTAPLWIVSLDARDAALYKTLRGEGYEEAHTCARLLLELFPADTFIQGVRMKESEEHLEQFFREWKKETENVIIQKYDTFAGFLPDKKVTDLSPLHRFPCWHNKRELAVLIDGTIPLCREDVKKTNILGNILKDPIETIWQQGNAVYTGHIQEQYPEICKGCDEYYTFNF